MDVGRLLYDDLYYNNLNEGAFSSAPSSPHPTDANIIMAPGAGYVPQISYDGGDTWTYSGEGFSGARAGHDGFAWDVNDHRRFIVFTLDYGPFLTEDEGLTFRNLHVPRYNGLETTPTGAIDTLEDSGFIVTAVGAWGRHLITVTEDEGDSWMQVAGTDDNYKYIAFHPDSTTNSKVVYAGRFRGTYANSEWTWDELERKIFAVSPFNGDTVYAYEMSPVNEEDTYKPIITIYISTDQGSEWEILGYNEELPIVYSKNIGTSKPQDVKVDPLNENRVYVTGHWNGVHIWDTDQWITEPCGVNNEDIKRDAFNTCSTGAIAIDPDDSSIVSIGKWIAFYGHSDGLYQSLDSGDTWENITYNLGPEFTPWALSVNPHNNLLFMGSSHGTQILCSDQDGDEIADDGGVCGNVDDCELDLPVKNNDINYKTIHSAYIEAINGDVIHSHNEELVEDLVLDLNKTVTLDGGYDCSFAGVAGMTTLKGSMEVISGQLTIGNYILE